MARIDFVTGNALIYLPEVEAIAVIPDRVEALLGTAPPNGTDTAGRNAARILGDLVAYAEHDQAALHRMAWMSDVSSGLGSPSSRDASTSAQSGAQINPRAPRPASRCNIVTASPGHGAIPPDASGFTGAGSPS